MTSSRVFSPVTPFAALCLLSSGAFAQSPPDRKACIEAHEQSQQRRLEGKLTEARGRLLVCARTECPGVIRKECGTWLGEVTASLPTVVVDVVASNGVKSGDVRVIVDGVPFADKIDGRAREIDPGEHLFRVEADDGSAADETVVVRQGEKNRTLTLTIVPKPTAAPPAPNVPTQPPAPPLAVVPRRAPVPIAAYALGGVALAGAGSFAYFGLSGKSRQNELLGTCSPECPPDSVDSVRRRYLVADISLGVSVVALGVATYLFITRPVTPPAASGVRGVRLGIASFAGGGVASVGGRF